MEGPSVEDAPGPERKTCHPARSLRFSDFTLRLRASSQHMLPVPGAVSCHAALGSPSVPPRSPALESQRLAWCTWPVDPGADVPAGQEPLCLLHTPTSRRATAAVGFPCWFPPGPLPSQRGTPGLLWALLQEEGPAASPLAAQHLRKTSQASKAPVTLEEHQYPARETIDSTREKAKIQVN